MARGEAGRLRTPTTHARWTPLEDFVLEQLVGKVTYEQIALKLGRSPGAVQRRASYKGLGQWQNQRRDKGVRKMQQERALRATEEELAEYL